MATSVIFGGAGFIGTHLARHLLSGQRFSSVHIADLKASPLAGTPGVTVSITDVRDEISRDLCSPRPEWIFNLAAIHREPGHAYYEYYDTNMAGARQVCGGYGFQGKRYTKMMCEV